VEARSSRREWASSIAWRVHWRFQVCLNNRIAVAFSQARFSLFHFALFYFSCSAGYFNTVGSAEGWTPQQFVSSRSKRASASSAEAQQAAETSRSAVNQKAADFMDQEDLEQFGLVEGLVARDDYDVLGGTAAELERKRREHARSGGASSSTTTATTGASAVPGASSSSSAAAAGKATSAIPGFSPEQMVGTVSSGVGARLLRTMGWREGQGVGARQQRRKKSTTAAAASGPASTSTTDNNDGDDNDPDSVLETFQFAPDNVKIVEYDLKQDRRGIGFDPYKNAEIVRKARALQRAAAGADDDEHTHDGRRTRLSLANALTGREDSRSMRGFGLGAFDNDDGDDDDADIYHQAALDAYDIDDTVESQQVSLLCVIYIYIYNEFDPYVSIHISDVCCVHYDSIRLRNDSVHKRVR
jgi:G patch domain-containing protein 1